MTLDDDSAIVMLPPSQPGMRVPRHPYPMAPGMRFWKWRITAASVLGIEIAN
jgi:hypothetical protein